MMKRRMVKYLIWVLGVCLAALGVGPVEAFAQGKIYTQTMRLADFPQKTTKIVLTGNTELDALLKEEITSRWRISPYEFCDYSEYKAYEHTNLYYFLHLASDSDFTYLLLTKGGPTSGNPLITFMDVVSFPIFAAGNPSPEELLYLPVFIDLVQEYLLKAMVSDALSYRGIEGIKHRRTKNLHLCKDAAEGRLLFTQRAKDTIVPIVIWPANNGRRKHYYRMLISTDTHLLYGFTRHRI